MDRLVCIHGHFYQPPRENPWLERVEVQDSAAPYHDWNERITAECYAPNTRSRIMDPDGRTLRIVNNFASISFDVGPTLLSWLESEAAEVYERILAADRESRRRFGGHGSAMAQSFNHTILPLASPDDLRLQIRWGLMDFESRFGRPAEGMWLPETAVNTPVLEAVAEAGIEFTVLAPTQARRIRPLSGGDWTDVSGGRIDPTTVYRARLPSGRGIDLFFYDGPISHALAFERLLDSGEGFAGRLTGAFSPDESARPWPQLVHVATDGETYGHHHRHGDMALAYALHLIESTGAARLTNYAEYRQRVPPRFEVEILENTAWSCAHGVDRWRADCGCSSGAHPGWNQAWRGPLRSAFDTLRDRLDPIYRSAASELLRDPREAREEYLRVVLDRSETRRGEFLARHGRRPLGPDERIRVWKLLEMERHLQLMYTSCGWFFDEVSGLESSQVIQYAGRAVQLAGELGDGGAEAALVESLRSVPSNLPEIGTAATVYDRFVRPTSIDLLKVCAHYAVSSLFEAYGPHTAVDAFWVDRREEIHRQIGGVRLAVGVVGVSSAVTTESSEITYGVIHLGGLNLLGGARIFRGRDEFHSLVAALDAQFEAGDLPGILASMTRRFDGLQYSLRSLFRDRQRQVVRQIMDGVLAGAEQSLRQVYLDSAPLLRFLSAQRIPFPPVFQTALQYTLNADLREEFGRRPLRVDRIRSLLDEARRWDTPIEGDRMGFAPRRALEALLADLLRTPTDHERLREAVTLAGIVGTLPYPVNLNSSQNLLYDLVADHWEPQRRRAEAGEPTAREWIREVETLAGLLRLRLPS